MRRLNLAGRTFNELTALAIAYRKGSSNYWTCRCTCGKETIVQARNLKSGRVKSCGCLRRKPPTNATHLMSRTREWKIWESMRQRCNKPYATFYPRYGGRGIGVCERWNTSFENFFADMGTAPSPKHSLHRIDNDGDYCLDNCCWSLPCIQMRNRHDTKLLTYGGETKPVAEWAEIFGIDRYTLLGRIRLGWPAEKVLTTPVTKHKLSR